MIVFKDMMDLFDAQMKECSEKQLDMLRKETDLLRVWAEKRREDVIVPESEVKTVMKIINYDGEVVEAPFEEKVLDLETANKKMLPVIDGRVSKLLSDLKKNKFESPSLALFGMMFFCLNSPELDSHYSGNWNRWVAARLVYDRIYSTARLAFRYQNVEKYGEGKVYNEDGSVTFYHGRQHWEDEMIKRKLMPRKKGKKNG